MKKYFLLLLIAALSIGVISFTSTDKEVILPPQMQKWYDFIGEDPTDPSDYEPHVGPPPNCAGGCIRCAVKALPLSGNPSQPDLNDPNIFILNYTP